MGGDIWDERAGIIHLLVSSSSAIHIGSTQTDQSVVATKSIGIERPLSYAMTASWRRQKKLFLPTTSAQNEGKNGENPHTKREEAAGRPAGCNRHWYDQPTTNIRVVFQWSSRRLRAAVALTARSPHVVKWNWGKLRP